MTKTQSKNSVGILGGGQLARMLALAAHNMGLIPWVLSTSPDDPAAQVTKWWIKGDPNNPKDLSRFLKNVDVLTVESEFLDAAVLERVCKNNKVKIFPSANLLFLLQDKLSQKIILRKSNLPTLPFIDIQHASHLDFAVKLFGLPLVLKKRRFGYDGYGIFILKSSRDLNSILKSLDFKNSPCIAEPWFKFKRELAVTIARSKKGQIRILPLVETKQKNSICHWVKGPVKSKFFNKMVKPICRFLKKIDYVGAISFEFFETKKELVINELAPRVHNSAHYSIDALTTSQFDYHLKAIIGHDLPVSKTIQPAFGTVNLLGSGKKNSQLANSPDTFLHWYGKSIKRKGRKMGHVNSLGDTPAQALAKARQAEKEFSK
ncbi:MAG: 5-(carboxyamino)imidazole ribonucleotide synthase [Pseudomonadota bacterium]|nr:5-(carboxyamino)imidazole ribonucleotide synthase [Pseudomonadota bacterium]